MTKTIHCKGTKLWDPPIYDGTTTLCKFLYRMEDEIVEDIRVPIIDVTV